MTVRQILQLSSWVIVTIGLYVGGSAATKDVFQSPSIAGYVADSSGAHRFSGVSIMVLRESGGVAARATSASDGLYQFDELPDGAYRIDFETPGFDITRRNNVHVREGATASVHVALYPSSVCECIDHSSGWRLQERTGRVVDDSDRPLPHARLDLVTPRRTEVAYADDDGRFQVRLPMEGSWPLTAFETGFGTLTLQASGATAGPIVFKLKSAVAPKARDIEQLSRGCRCLSDLFSHTGR